MTKRSILIGLGLAVFVIVVAFMMVDSELAREEASQQNTISNSQQQQQESGSSALSTQKNAQEDTSLIDSELSAIEKDLGSSSSSDFESAGLSDL
jgi:predicted metalloprotease